MQIKLPVTKDQLKKYRSLRIELINQTERIERLRTKIEYCSPKLTDEPKSSSTQNGLPDNICRLIELEKLYQQQLDNIENATFKIEKVIQSIDEPLEREVLRLRYIDCHDWSSIQTALHYERSEIFRIHSRALAALLKLGTLGD